MENLEERLTQIETKLDKILEYQKWEKNEWKDSQSSGANLKRWISFYLASLVADETLGLNGTNGIFGTIKRNTRY